MVLSHSLALLFILNLKNPNFCLSEGEISEVNGYLFPKHFMTAGKAQADKIMSMKGSEKGVIVVGLAKTGNHFFYVAVGCIGL